VGAEGWKVRCSACPQPLASILLSIVLLGRVWLLVYMPCCSRRAPPTPVWRYINLPRQHRLAAADAKLVEDAFEHWLSELAPSATVGSPARVAPRPRSMVGEHGRGFKLSSRFLTSYMPMPLTLGRDRRALS
jgi:hypothetical protein